MKENFPQLEIETKEPGRQEKIAVLGNRALEGEAEFKTPIHRRRGFMLATFLALGMTLFAGQAEARGRSWGSQLGREAATNAIAAARNGVTMVHNEKILEINAWHQAEIAKLIEAKSQLDLVYNQQKQELREKGDQTGLYELEREYQEERIRLAQAKEKLRRERELKLAGTRIRRDAIRGGIGILRPIVRGRL